MSYILDALRRADAQRTQGQLPGLHTQAQPFAAADGGPGAARRWLLPALGLAALLMVAALAVVLLTRPGPRSVAQVTPEAPAVHPAAVVRPTARAAPPPPAPASDPLAAPPPPLPILVTAPADTPQAAQTARARAAEPAPVPLATLSPQQRAALPPLAIGGWVWSESAAQRFVVIDGALRHEGEPAAPGVTLERIGPRSVVLRWREGRVEVPL